MNDLYVGAFSSIVIHGLVFCAYAGTMNAPTLDVREAPSSIELSLVASRPEIQTIVEKIQEEVPEEILDTAVLQESREEIDDERAAEPNVKAEEQIAYDALQGAITDPEPHVFENAAPVYPRLARERGYEGEVLLKVEVTESGICGYVGIKQSSGYGILDQAAIKAVRTWRFRPAMRGKKMFASTIELPIVFRLEE